MPVLLDSERPWSHVVSLRLPGNWKTTLLISELKKQTVWIHHDLNPKLVALIHFRFRSVCLSLVIQFEGGRDAWNYYWPFGFGLHLGLSFILGKKTNVFQKHQTAREPWRVSRLLFLWLSGSSRVIKANMASGLPSPEYFGKEGLFSTLRTQVIAAWISQRLCSLLYMPVSMSFLLLCESDFNPLSARSH